MHAHPNVYLAETPQFVTPLSRDEAKRCTPSAVRTLRGLFRTLQGELAPWLAPAGLTLQRLVELADAASSDQLGERQRSVGRLVHLYGFQVDEVAEMTGLNVDTVKALVESSPRSRAQHTVLEMHVGGATVSDIHERTGIARSEIYRWLGEANVTPNRRNAAIDPVLRSEIIDAYNWGSSYGEIAKRYGLPRARVAQVVRTAASRDLCPGYGTGQRGSK